MDLYRVKKYIYSMIKIFIIMTFPFIIVLIAILPYLSIKYIDIVFPIFIVIFLTWLVTKKLKT